MQTLLCVSKEKRIENRRNRIKQKLEEQNDKILPCVKKEKEKDELENIKDDKNIENEILDNFNLKKNDYIEEISNKIKREETLFFENIKKYEILDKNLVENKENEEKIKNENELDKLHSIKNINKFDSKNDFVEINNLALKEKETYNKKLEKYFSLLKYKDEKIQKLCEINSENVSSFIDMMRNQIEGYKIYLEDIFNKTRDNLNSKRRKLLNDNKNILDDFLKLQNLMPNYVNEEILQEKIMNEKIKMQQEKYNIDLKSKNNLLKNNLKININYIEKISEIIINKEKKIYEEKLLEQKNVHCLKMINFYKSEINKLREILLSVKTHYYNYKMKSKKNINELINQYERIKFQFIELQKRQKHYEQKFQKKYITLWRLQKDEATKDIEKLISANKIIHEEIFLTKNPNINYKYLLEENENINFINNDQNDQEKITIYNKKVTEEQIENVKKLLLQECIFLIDDNNEKKSDEEKLKDILKYIGVNNKSSLEFLCQMFYIDEIEDNENIKENINNEENEKIKTDDIEEKEIINEIADYKKNHEKIKKIKSQCVSPEYTLDIIFKYCKEKEKENIYNITKNKKKYINRFNASLKLMIEKKKKEKEYWNRLLKIIPEDTIELWKTFLSFVDKYFNILKERSDIIDIINAEKKLAKENLNKLNKLKEMKNNL